MGDWIRQRQQPPRGFSRAAQISGCPIRTASTDHPANIRGQDALSRRSWRRCPPASRMDEPPRSHWADTHIGPPNASRWCRPDRRRWPTMGRSPQPTPAHCLWATPAPSLGRPQGLSLRGRIAHWPKGRQSRNISSETPLVGSSRSVGSCRANATFLAFVPSCCVDCSPAMTAGAIAACCDQKLSL